MRDTTAGGMKREEGAAPPDGDQRSTADPAGSAAAPLSEAGQRLIRRGPAGYLWNQAGSLWLFVSLLLFEVVVRRSLPQGETNVFDAVATVANLGFYVASLGLTSAGTVYLPRALVEGGPAYARALALRLVVSRIAAALVVGAAIIWATPALVAASATAPWSPVREFAGSFIVQALLAHRVVVAAYVVGVGVSTLLSSLLIALVRTRIVFIFGGLAQGLVLALAYVLIARLDTGVEGAMLAQVLPPLMTAIIFAVILWRALAGGTESPAQPPRFFGPSLRLAVAAWLADLPNASLVQPLAIGQLSAVAPSQLLFFKSTYQMGDAGSRFFTDGLGGISLALMSASYAGRRLPSLAIGWRTVNKLQVLLATPLVVFSIPHAAAIMALLFGSLYASSGVLLAVFLVLNGVLQLLGGATHEWALYVLGRQRWVVVSRWATLGILAVSGVLLVPRYFALGALLAVGIGRLAAQLFLFALARSAVRRPYPFAFAGKLLATLIPPVVVTALWQPAALVERVVASLPQVIDGHQPAVTSALLLAADGIVFLALFLIGLWLVRPLDAEDAALLAQAPGWLRRVLRPLISRASSRRPAPEPEPEPVPAARR